MHNFNSYDYNVNPVAAWRGWDQTKVALVCGKYFSHTDSLSSQCMPWHIRLKLLGYCGVTVKLHICSVILTIEALDKPSPKSCLWACNQAKSISEKQGQYEPLDWHSFCVMPLEGKTMARRGGGGWRVPDSLGMGNSSFRQCFWNWKDALCSFHTVAS